MTGDRVEEALSLEELSKHLADAEGTTAEALERATHEFDIGRPWEADILESDE